MPRTATPISAEVARARLALEGYFEKEKISETELARVTGVRQYTISRFRTGRTKTITPEIEKVLVHAINGMNADPAALLRDPRIHSALGRAWDGTGDGIALIAGAIDALAPVLRAAQRSERPRFTPDNGKTSLS